jgi:hypothetical protein
MPPEASLADCLAPAERIGLEVYLTHFLHVNQSERTRQVTGLFAGRLSWADARRWAHEQRQQLSEPTLVAREAWTMKLQDIL